MSELKKCPFCGGKARIKDDIEHAIGGYWVECAKCHIQTPEEIRRKESSIKYWNR